VLSKNSEGPLIVFPQGQRIGKRHALDGRTNQPHNDALDLAEREIITAKEPHAPRYAPATLSAHPLPARAGGVAKSPQVIVPPP
jgi:hypothetical protein